MDTPSDSNLVEARACIEKAILLVGKTTVYTLLWNLTSPTPDTMTPTTQSPSATSEGRRRGRRPGAADNESRCHWILADKSQCKNSQQDSSQYCKIHLPKVHLLEDSPGASHASS